MAHRALTKPSSLLRDVDKPKAKILSGVMLVFFPLGALAAFISPVVTVLKGETPVPPSAISIIALLAILGAYFLSRSRYYWIGAWFAILIPPIAIIQPIVETGVVTTAASLFYLALSVILAGLLRTSVETFFIGGVIALLILILPDVEGAAVDENLAAFSFILLTTVLTGMVGRNREYYVALLEESQSDLLNLNKTLEARVEDRTTELKTARDEALVAQRIANENSRLKSEFLSMMSHELRTPMNAIEGFTSIMLKRMAGVTFNDKTERYLTKVQSNSQRLLALINDILDLSRIESGRLELAHLPMSPKDMAQTWRDNLSVLAENKRLAFELTVDPNLPEQLYGDEESISKIAVNLVGNAIKFTETGVVQLSLHRRGDQLELQVSDTGIGIPAHARDFIFDEFRQVDQSSKRQHGGTGLGLAIVQKLARAMGGTVSLHSEVGEGSTFTVLLPVQTERLLTSGVSHDQYTG